VYCDCWECSYAWSGTLNEGIRREGRERGKEGGRGGGREGGRERRKEEGREGRQEGGRGVLNYSFSNLAIFSVNNKE